MDTLKNICLYLVVGAIINGFCHLLSSDYLSQFLHNQIITLSITLVAITSAVRGIVLGKITELKLSHNQLDFTETFQELKLAIKEQTVMILVSILLMIIINSKKIPHEYLIAITHIIDSILTSILLFNIYILYDMGIATIDIFVAINNREGN